MQNKTLLLSTAILVFALSLVGVYVFAQVTGVSHNPLEIECTSNLCIQTGKVGIGTTSPSYKLHVYDNSVPQIAISGPNTTYKNYNLIDTTSDKTWQISHRTGDQSNQLRINYYNGSSWSNYFTILTDGNVGIGTTSPSYKLHVSGTGYFGNLGVSGGITIGTGADNEWTPLYLLGDNHWLINAHSGTGTSGTRDGSLFINMCSSYNQSGLCTDYGNNYFTIASNGNIGIRVGSPIAELHIGDVYGAGGKNLLIGDDTYLTDVDEANTLGIYGNQDSKTAALRLGSSGVKISADSGNFYIRTVDNQDTANIQVRRTYTTEIYNTWYGGDLTIAAEWDINLRAKSKNVYIRDNTGGDTGVLNVFRINATQKNFVIPHPTKSGMKLLHASIEGPENAVYYRGEAKLKNGRAVVKLPDYFEALTRKEGRTVLLTCKNGWSPLWVEGEIKNGRFIVKTTEWGNKNQSFYWEVKAVRADIEPLKVEVKENELGK